MLEETGYLAELEAEHTIEAQGRIENLQELVGVCREFDEAIDAGDLTGLPGIAGVGTGESAEGAANGESAGELVLPTGLTRIQVFLEAISLVTDLDTAEGAGGEQSAVTLMTLHSAKGLEYPGGVPDRSRGRSASRTCAASAIPTSSRRNGGSATWASLARANGSTSATPGAACCSAPPTTTRRAASSRRSPKSSSMCSGERAPNAASARAIGPSAHRDAVVAAAMRDAVGSRRAPRGAEGLGLRVGDDVAHDKFGEGVIIDLIGDGDKTEAVVELPRGRREAPAAGLGAAAEDLMNWQLVSPGAASLLAQVDEQDPLVLARGIDEVLVAVEVESCGAGRRGSRRNGRF